MKDYMIFDVLIFLVKNKKTTATEVAERLEISPRSVYRYIDSLTLLGVPIQTKLGRGGGIELYDSFYLESLILTEEEREILRQFVKTKNCDLNVKKIINKLI